MNVEWLYQLICSRMNEPVQGSYTSALFHQGLPRIAQKVGEESVEIVVASLAEDDERLIAEIADLMYHLLVLIAWRGIKLEAIVKELEKRHQ